MIGDVGVAACLDPGAATRPGGGHRRKCGQARLLWTGRGQPAALDPLPEEGALFGPEDDGVAAAPEELPPDEPFDEEPPDEEPLDDELSDDELFEEELSDDALLDDALSDAEAAFRLSVR